MKNIGFIFPGQGSQYTGMGKDFYDNFKIVKKTFENASDALHKDVAKMTFFQPQEDTVNSQISIFVVSISILNVLKKEFTEIVPSICSGLSLGEYSALVSSNKVSFEAALSLVYKRAKFMKEACLSKKGAMSAVIGIEANLVEEIVKNFQNKSYEIWVANYNSSVQTVISGSIEGIDVVTKALKEKKAKVIPLKVHGAFHSPFMKEAAFNFEKALEDVSVKESNILLVMNAKGDFVDFNEIKKYLVLQITNSVRWKAGILKMLDSGINVFIEIGPKKVLTQLNKKKNATSSLNISIEKVDELKDLTKVG